MNARAPSIASPPPPTRDLAPAQVLKRHGRSFHFAAKFLGARHAENGAVVYAFCRHVDDVADTAIDIGKAQNALDEVDMALQRGVSEQPAVRDFLVFARDRDLDIAIPQALIAGVRSDLSCVRLADEADLIRYAYHVAGVVGLMMCAALDVDAPHAHPFAIDLGIAMQLTNIARDVAEDAAMGRRYLPGAWVDGLEPADLRRPGADIDALIADAQRRLLALADRYYASGEAGMGHLPARARFAILVAARVYRAIGLRMRRAGFRHWRRRAVVPGPAKIRIAAHAAGLYATQASLHRVDAVHDPSLHRALAGLPGVDHG